ncbi:MAG: hypothetical protein H7839_06220 [Magnetococcus sp. YQC-5]
MHEQDVGNIADPGFFITENTEKEKKLIVVFLFSMPSVVQKSVNIAAAEYARGQVDSHWYGFWGSRNQSYLDKFS